MRKKFALLVLGLALFFLPSWAAATDTLYPNSMAVTYGLDFADGGCAQTGPGCGEQYVQGGGGIQSRVCYWTFWGEDYFCYYFTENMIP